MKSEYLKHKQLENKVSLVTFNSVGRNNLIQGTAPLKPTVTTIHDLHTYVFLS